MTDDIIAEFFSVLLTFSLSLYKGFLTNLIYNTVNALIWVIFIKIALEILFNIFPFLEKIAKTLFLPFAYVHQLSHIHKAKQINAKHKNKFRKDLEDSDRPNLFYKPKIAVRPTFYVGKEERAGMSIVPYEPLSLSEVIGLMYAPSKYGTGFFLITLFTAPIVIYHYIFIAIHFYILAGALIYLFPSSDDYKYIINTLLANTTLSPWYFLHGITTFTGTAYVYTQLYKGIGFPPYWYADVLAHATSTTIIYYTLLFLVIFFTGSDTMLSMESERMSPTPKVPEYVEESIDLSTLLATLDDIDESIDDP